jgi:hypothetical protein
MKRSIRFASIHILYIYTYVQHPSIALGNRGVMFPVRYDLHFYILRPARICTFIVQG